MAKCNSRFCKNVILEKVRDDIKLKPREIKQLNALVLKIEDYFQKAISPNIKLSKINIGALDSAIYLNENNKQTIKRISANLNIAIAGFKTLKTRDGSFKIRLDKQSPLNYFKIDKYERDVMPKRIIDFLISEINYPPKNSPVIAEIVRAERIKDSHKGMIKIKIKKEIFDFDTWINFDIGVFLKTDEKEFISSENNEWTISSISENRFLSRDLFVNCKEVTVEVFWYLLSYLNDDKGYPLSHDWQAPLVKAIVKEFQDSKKWIVKCPNIKFLKLVELLYKNLTQDKTPTNKIILNKVNKLFKLTINKRTLCSDVHLWNNLINNIKGLQRFSK